MVDLPDQWRAYARLQLELARTSRVNGQSWGGEAALTRLLTSHQDNQAPSDEYVSRAVATARRRERHRGVLRLVHSCEERLSPSPEDEFITKSSLTAIASQVTEEEWSILSKLADGRDYTAIAASLTGSTVGGLRVRVTRLRKRLAKVA